MLDRTCEEMFQGQAKSVGLSKLIPELLKIADDDKQGDVREAAMECFGSGYRCFGNRIKTDLLKRLGLLNNALIVVIFGGLKRVTDGFY